MAPLRRERPHYAQSSTPLDSGFASATTRSRTRRTSKIATVAVESHEASPRSRPLTQGDFTTTSRSDWRPPPLALQDIEAVRAIGSGGWGSVHVARVKRKVHHPLERPGACFALKVVGKNVYRDNERNYRNAKATLAAEWKHAERRFLSTLPWNPFIGGLLDAYLDSKNVYLAMELGPCGTLFSQGWNRAYNDREIPFYFANIVLALEFLHTHGVVHCDVKMDNLVMGQDGYLMLIDFGLAQPLHSKHKWHKGVGTLEYMSPESVAAHIEVNSPEKRLAVDWWSAAVCLYEMKTRQHPWTCNSISELEELLENLKLTWPAGIHVHEDLKDLVAGMFHPDLEQRYGARVVPEGENGGLINREIRTHPFMRCINWERVEKRVMIAPRTPNPPLEPDNRRHRVTFLEQSKVPALPLKRPSPRYGLIKLDDDREECPLKKRRLEGGGSKGVPLEQTPSMTVNRGSYGSNSRNFGSRDLVS
ncbi:kinase-like domain-containing protein [Trametes meyenii]|nr:kinase-like domain-containing protein [Trametes meyenii]